jgi:hypothetical protein
MVKKRCGETLMEDEVLYIVTVEEQDYRFNSLGEFCDFMSENSHLRITCIEKVED